MRIEVSIEPEPKTPYLTSLLVEQVAGQLLLADEASQGEFERKLADVMGVIQVYRVKWGIMA